MLDAGQVATFLTGKFDPAAFKAYDAANKRAIASATAAEAQMTSAAQRGATAHDAMSAAAGRSAAANERLATSGNRVRNSLRDSHAAMAQWDKSSQQAAKSLNTLGRGAAIGAGVGLASLAAATIYAAKTAGDFEKAMRNVNSIAKLSEDGYHKLSKGVLSLAGETAQAPKVLAEGLYQLVSSGFSASDSLKILHASAKAATAGLTDTKTATTAVAAVLNAYRLPATQASQASDILFETVNRGVLTFEELSKHIGEVLPYAAALGVSLPQVGAAISTMTKEGINAPETMTRLRRVIQSFIKPSKDMSAAIKATGASSGEALVKQKGLQGAVEAVSKTTDGQKASLAKLFPDIRALGGVLALTGKNAKAAAQDLKAFKDTGGATQKVFNEQAKGAEFAGKRLSASFQTAAIIVGNQVLPHLADAAGQFTQILQKAASDGSLERFGQTALHIFGTLGTAAGDLVGPLRNVAEALIFVGQAAGLGNPTELAALAAAFLAFKAASTIVPILFAVGGAIRVVIASAAAASTIGEFAWILGSLVGPAGLIVGALTLAAGAFVAFSGSFGGSTSAAEANAKAMRDDKKAIEDLHDATKKASEAGLAAKRAALEHKEAVEARKRTEAETRGPHARLKGAAAENAIANARLREAEAAHHEANATGESTKQLEANRQAGQKALSVIAARSRETQKQIAALDNENKAVGSRNRALSDGTNAQAKMTRLQHEATQQAEATARANLEIAVSQESLNRLNAGQSAITSANAQGVHQLQQALSQAHAPQKVITRYELDDQGAQAKLGALSAKLSALGQQQIVAKVLTTAPSAAVAIEAFKAILAGVPSSKVVRILHNAPHAKSAMAALADAVRAVPGVKGVTISTNASGARLEIQSVQSAIDGLTGFKSVTIAIRKTTESVENIVRGIGKRASGRTRGPGEAAIVGEGSGSEYVIDRSTGAGVVVSGPTLMGLSPDDYVVPLEKQYRGRALGLFAALARDLEIPGYKAGRHAAKHKPKAHRPIPGKLDPLSLPVEELQTKADAAKSAYDAQHSHVKALGKKAKGSDRAKEKQDRTAMLNLRKDLAQAKAYQARITKETDLANIAANDMRLADGRDNEPGYRSAKARRLAALAALKGLISGAMKHVKVDSAYMRKLQQELGAEEIAAQSTEGEAFSSPAAEREASTGMTDAEQARLKKLEADQALAALTPGTGDDTSTAQQIVGFLEGVLGEVKAEPGARGGDESIKSIAQALQSARSNLASLTGGGATNENADLQAQLTQAKERAEVATRGQQIAEQALQVFGGAGDIGSGRGGVVINQTNNMLHPADPHVLSAIGSAATAGIGLQGSRRAVRQQVGP